MCENFIVRMYYTVYGAEIFCQRPHTVMSTQIKLRGHKSHAAEARSGRVRPEGTLVFMRK